MVKFTSISADGQQILVEYTSNPKPLDLIKNHLSPEDFDHFIRHNDFKILSLISIRFTEDYSVEKIHFKDIDGNQRIFEFNR